MHTTPALTHPSQVLLQAMQGMETRTVAAAAMLSDGISISRCQIDGLVGHQAQLRGGGCLPVGSVEFVSAAMDLADIARPTPDPYPSRLAPWFFRAIERRHAGGIAGRCFVKPAARLKAFDGFVLDPGTPSLSMTEHAQEQLAALQQLGPDEMVWVCEPVEFLSEWRYYVQGGSILGSARYDPDGPDDAPQPLATDVEQAIVAYGRHEAHALDMGVLSTGQTALVEVNDAFAIGLYAGALEPHAYLAYLWSRWMSLARDSAGESR
jgi:hypothetical protein